MASAVAATCVDGRRLAASAEPRRPVRLSTWIGGRQAAMRLSKRILPASANILNFLLSSVLFSSHIFFSFLHSTSVCLVVSFILGTFLAGPCSISA